MSYVQRTIWEKRLPAFSGLFVLLFALGVTIFLSRNTVLFVTKATVGSQPKNVQVSNISNTAFTVSYTTDEGAIGEIAYGTAPGLGNVALDDRDQQLGKPTEHRVHFITLQNLSPKTKYYFTITSGTVNESDNGAPFEVTTAPEESNKPSDQADMAGTVALDDGTIPIEGIVSVSTEGSQVLTTLLKQDGSYTMPLTKLRTKTLTAYVPLTPDTKMNVQINTSDLQSTASILTSQTNQVPRIVMAKNYDFTLSPDPLGTSIASSSGDVASQSSFPIVEQPASANSPDITTPKDDQKFKDQRPTFQGVALPNADIEIVINSAKEITAKLQSDANGQWLFKPPVALDPGVHTITISSLDASGTLQKLTRSFTVYAAGSQFTEPSVSPIQDASPTDIPPVTPTVAAVPTATPTLQPTPTVMPTATPAPTTSITPTRGPLGATGSSVVMNGIFGSVIAIAIGALLFVFTAL